MNLSAVSRLSQTGQHIVKRLLQHRAMKRLGAVRQLGFWSGTPTFRLQHTIESIECAALFLEKVPNLSPAARDHFIAAVALEDFGRAPFSNSLDPMFRSFSDCDSPIDVERTVAVVRYLESKEQLLSQLNLWPDTIFQLIRGHIPWPGARKLRSLLNGPTDIDRLMYIKGDTGAIDGTLYDITNVAKGLIFDAGDGTPIIDAAAITPVVDMLLQRTRLYMQSYYDPEKLGMEAVVREFLSELWASLEARPEAFPELQEPRTIDDFLTWTDDSILRAFREDIAGILPGRLERLRQLIREGGLQVAEIRLHHTQIVALDEIVCRFSAPKEALQRKAYHWILDKEKLPSLRAFEPGTILVKNRGRHDGLEETPQAKSVPELTQRVVRCPLIVFPTDEYPPLQTQLRDHGLQLSNAVALESIKRCVVA